MNNVHARTTYCLVTGMKIHNSESLSQEEAAVHMRSLSELFKNLQTLYTNKSYCIVIKDDGTKRWPSDKANQSCEMPVNYCT